MIELKNLIKFAIKKVRPSKNKKPFSIAFNLTSEFNEVSKTRAGGRFFEANHKKSDDLEAEKFGSKSGNRLAI
jgi:hypothetical protein